MTLLEMRDALRRRIGNPTVTDVSDSRLNQLLNESNRYIMDRFPFHASRNLWVISTVVGTQRYALPTDLGTLLKVGHRTAGVRGKIHRADAQFQFREGTSDANVTGIPHQYTRMADWIQLYPIPGEIYDIALFYKTVIADMVLDADTSPIPATWHMGIVFYARYMFYDGDGDIGKAQYSYASWSLWLESKPNELQDEVAADSDFGADLPTLRSGNADAYGFRRGFDYDE